MTSQTNEAISGQRPLKGGLNLFPLIVWMWSKRFKTGYISETLEVSPRTVNGYLRHIRSRIEGKGLTYTGQLSGKVHVDAWTYRPRLNLAPPKRSYPPKRPILLGMLSAEGQLRLFVISSKSRREIHPLIKAHVLRGSTIIANRSNLYTELRKDGYPDLIQVSSSELKSRCEFSKEGPNIYFIWGLISKEMNSARGVRAANYIPRVREVELRWFYRNMSIIHLYRHVMSLVLPGAECNY